MRLRNRIVMAPMGDNLASDDGTVGDRQAALEARARGGEAAAHRVGGRVYQRCVKLPDGDRRTLRPRPRRAGRPGPPRRASPARARQGQLAVRHREAGSCRRSPAAPGALSADPPVEMDAMIRPFTTPTGHKCRIADADDIAWLIDGSWLRPSGPDRRPRRGQIRNGQPTSSTRSVSTSARRVGRLDRQPGPSPVRGHRRGPGGSRRRDGGVVPHQLGRALPRGW
jgi:hypothetical protein